MPHIATPANLIRVTSFAALWLIIFAVRLKVHNDPEWIVKVGLLAIFMLLAVVVVVGIQIAARWKIPWPIELLALPFVGIAISLCGLALRSLIRSR